MIKSPATLSQGILSFLVAGFTQQPEHVSLIEFHTGLVEGVDPQHISGNAAGKLEEIEHFAQLFVGQFSHVHGDHRHVAVHMGGQCTLERLLIYKVKGLTL